MQDTCNGVATKRVITTLTSALPTQMKMEYNVMYNFVSRYMQTKKNLVGLRSP